MGAGAIVILVIIAIAVAAVFATMKGDKKSDTPAPKTPSAPTTGGDARTSGRLGGTMINPPPYPNPNNQTVTSRHGALSVFTYRTTSPFWLCPNCECENTPDRTHCCVCLWDRSVEVR